MTQIIVNFLQASGIGSSTLETDPRIFDFEIDPSSQAYYAYEMAKILQGMGASIQPSTGGAPIAVDAAFISQAITDGTLVQKLSGGTIVFGGATDAQAVSDGINLLNNWSAMKLVKNGVQTATYGAIGTSLAISGTVLPTSSGQIVYPNGFPTDSSGNPLVTMIPPDGGAVGVSSLTSTMDQYMAQGLDKLIRSLRAAGWDPIADPTASGNATTAIANVTGASTSAIYNVANVLKQAISAMAQTHLKGQAAITDSMSIQQVLMVDYVSRGNEILFNEMQLLKTAVDLNQQALSYLNSLQDLMNQKDPQKFIMQLQNLNGVNINTSNPQSQFDKFEKATYDQSLQTLSRLGAESPTTYAAYFLSLNPTTSTPAAATATDPLAKAAFTSLSAATNQIAAYSVNTITANLTYLINQLGAQGGSVAGGLIQSLNSVKADFTGLTTGPGADPSTAIKRWIQDTQSADAGGFQRNLSNAIVASQSFNDTERENLREVMFVFEEFYKSATGLLSRLTQLLEKMADGIAR